MRRISDFSVKHPVTILMLVLGTLVLGYISFQRLGVDLFPDLNNPRLFVEMKAGERPPEELEKQILQGVESMASRQRGVIGVRSLIRVGSAQTTVENSWDTDMDQAFLSLQKGLLDYQQNSDLDEITISQHDPNAEPILTLALWHPEIDDMDELRRVAENYLRNELIRLEGIAGVEISGQEQKEVFIETDPYLLEAYGLTVSDIAGKIRSYNHNASGGSITEMGRRYLVKGVGVFESLSDIEGIIVAWRRGAADDASGQSAPGYTAEGANVGGPGSAATDVPVFLKDVANIDYRNEEPLSIVRLDGRRGLGLAVYKEMKFNTVQASANLQEALERIELALPGYHLEAINDQGEFISAAIDEVKQTALIGIFLAVLVLFVFLRRIGTTAIVSIAIPISVVATFNLMYFNGLSLNMMTLGGLALGAGMLVDNAIIVMENIIRNLEAGKKLRKAAIEGTAQVGGAITASTITTIVVFLPIVYLHGAAGELFKDQAWTVAFSLLSSLAVALLVIPMLCSRFLKERVEAHSERPVEKPAIRFDWYAAVLEGALRRRWPIVGLAAVLVAVAVALLPVIGSEFIPRAGTEAFSIQLTLPEGTELTRTEGTVIGIEQIVTEVGGDDVASLFSRVGPANGLGVGQQAIFQDENTATIRIVLAEGSRAAEAIIAELGKALAAIPDVEAQFIQDQTALQMTLGTESAPIVVEILGDEMETLVDLSNQVKVELQGMPDLFNVETSLEQGRPEVEVVVDRLRAGLYGVSVEQIAQQLRNLLGGTDAGFWEHAGEKPAITIKLPDIGVGDLENLQIDSGGRRVRLAEVAQIRRSQAPREIHRRNQVRAGVVTAHLHDGRPFDHVVGEIRERLAGIPLPADYKLQITGEEERRAKEFADLRFALLLSIILVYMVLASQFGSLVHPFTILLTIPLAGVGAVLIFFLLGKALNVMAYIGIILLVGIAVNDSIIFVDAINKLKERGLARRVAIVEAGRRRIRPIVMTSATTVLALLPLTLGFGEGAALRAPMALAVIGGLVTSTLLTLIVLPCMYSLLDRVGSKSG